MKLLATMPGLRGDIFQALLVVRSLAEHFGQQVAFKISHHFADMAALIAEQDYVSRVITDPWNLADTGPVLTLERYEAGDSEPWKPLSWPEEYDCVAHLQYRGWPSPTCIEASAAAAETDLGLERGELRLEPERPWIKTKKEVPLLKGAIIANWRATDYADKERFIFSIVYELDRGVYVGAPDEEKLPRGTFQLNWQETAAVLQEAEAFVGCQSAPWVLAAAVGVQKIVTVEPDERRLAAEFQIPVAGMRRAAFDLGAVKEALR